MLQSLLQGDAVSVAVSVEVFVAVSVAVCVAVVHSYAAVRVLQCVTEFVAG